MEKSILLIASHYIPSCAQVNRDDLIDVDKIYGGVEASILGYARNMKNIRIVWFGFNPNLDKLHILRYQKALDIEFHSYPIDKAVFSNHEHFWRNGLWLPMHEMYNYGFNIRPYVLDYFKVQEILAHHIITYTNQHQLFGIFVLDIQCWNLGKILRKNNNFANQIIGFFLPIPFPSNKFFQTIFNPKKMLLALMEYNFIGVQTQKDATHLTRVTENFVRNHALSLEVGNGFIMSLNRAVKIYLLPCRIDTAYLSSLSVNTVNKKNQNNVEEIIQRAAGRRIITWASRLDPTKGADQALKVCEILLENEELVQDIFIVYINQKCGYDNGIFQIYNKNCNQTASYLENKHPKLFLTIEGISRQELLTILASTNICLITSLKDGQNLVAQEWLYQTIHNKTLSVYQKSLILTKMTGFTELIKNVKGSIIINNPYNTTEIVEKIKTALSRDIKISSEIVQQQFNLLKKKDALYVSSKIITAFSNR